MLFVRFTIHALDYGLDARQVAIILPCLGLRPLDKAPPEVAGLLDYQHELVPVIDLCRMQGHPAAPSVLSTRYLLVHYPVGDKTRLLGLIAQNVTSIVDVDESGLRDSGLKLDEAPYLGPLARKGESWIQILSVENLLTPATRALLFPAKAS
jgi:chemotaxis-related protein WspB